jgi:hypothetical protein
MEDYFALCVAISESLAKVHATVDKIVGSRPSVAEEKVRESPGCLAEELRQRLQDILYMARSMEDQITRIEESFASAKSRP